MKKPFWTIARRRRVWGYAAFVGVWALSPLVAVLLGVKPTGGLADFAFYLPVAVVAAASRYVAQWLYSVYRRQWFAKQCEARGVEGVTRHMLTSEMWEPLVNACHKNPSLLVSFASAEITVEGIAKNVSVSHLFERKALAVASSGVWGGLTAEQGDRLVKTLVSYAGDDRPEDLRAIFEETDADSALAYLAVTQDSAAALNAVRAGIPVEYLRVTR